MGRIFHLMEMVTLRTAGRVLYDLRRKQANRTCQRVNAIGSILKERSKNRGTMF
jgi:hypothetical protein